MTSVVSFGDVKDPDGTVCERIMRGEAVNSCGSEWVGTYGCDSSWMDVCGTDHPGGPAYNDVTVAQSQLCQTECPDDGGGFPFEQIVSHSDFWCGGDQPDRMMSDSQGALSGSCEEAISMMETQWGVNGENACVDPGALPYESGAPRGWFQFVCCNTCGVGTMH
eukprot:CAMPEP_0118643208 /NCGR_PEP_ID=MMETSP0785-20121206/6270_1 /TAXON_ID=91992 /ORGANISM="Bolidomonas pacifica, Strain CCMP 1866" /LENGTH=163 /DNA_ID=CAMNT_0006534859 /DNA_START=39 /DNA_END=530 /DNA_ORIENTATION=-